jgi:hypothetical protein
MKIIRKDDTILITNSDGTVRSSTPVNPEPAVTEPVQELGTLWDDEDPEIFELKDEDDPSCGILP